MTDTHIHTTEEESSGVVPIKETPPAPDDTTRKEVKISHPTASQEELRALVGDDDEEEYVFPLQRHFGRDWRQRCLRQTELACMLAGAGMPGALVHISSQTMINDDRCAAEVVLRHDDGRYRTAYIDIITGAPTWRQFIDVMHGAGAHADVKVVVYDAIWDDGWLEGPGDEFLAVNLTCRNNRCKVPTYLVRADIQSRQDGSVEMDYQCTEGPDTPRDPLDTFFPTHQQMEEALFWQIHYWPCMDDEFYEPDEELFALDCVRLMCHLTCTWSWTDTGLFIKITAPESPEWIPWIWNHRQQFDEEFPGRPMTVHRRDGNPYQIDLSVDDMPVTEMVRMPPSEKERLGKWLRDRIGTALDIGEDLVRDYRTQQTTNGSSDVNS